MTKRNKQEVKEKRNQKKESLGRVIRERFEEQRIILPLTAKTERQQEALDAFTKHQLIVLSGSAGVGKTELAAWWACKQWLEGKVDNIIITRPYQHLGKDYGAVKGNDSEKLLMFCMSILMKLKKYLGVGILKNNFKLEGFESLFREASGISIVPIEKIQGMSFSDRTIILADELQNATIPQVKSLTTRAEEGCQIIAMGDNKQTALKGKNGLSFIEDVLERFPSPLAQVVHFQRNDVVRGGLTGHLVKAYEEMGDVW